MQEHDDNRTTKMDSVVDDSSIKFSSQDIILYIPCRFDPSDDCARSNEFCASLLCIRFGEGRFVVWVGVAKSEK